jgi:hypothetical protein
VLRDYGWAARREEFDERVALARAWLQKAQPVTSSESADKINGLRDAGMSVSELRPDVEAILKADDPVDRKGLRFYCGRSFRTARDTCGAVLQSSSRIFKADSVRS